ncbi:hypothetical protein Esti_002242 [Eimeria stiedai]
MVGPLPVGSPPGQTGAPEPLACETLPLYALELDGVFAGLRGYRGPPEVGAPSSSASLLALESQVRANPFDKHTWDSILAESPSTEVYEQVLEVFPTSAFYWRGLAELEVKNRNFLKAHSVYRRCLHACPQLELWLSYVKFIYCTGSVNDFRVALTSAVEKLRWDPRTGPLWQELLLLHIRIYNASLLNRGITQGLLSDFTGQATGPLIPTDVEQRAFRAPCGSARESLTDKYADINILRNAFQSCLGTAIAGMDGVWTAHCAFERSVGSTAHFAAKVVAAFEERYADARKTYAELMRLTRDMDWSLVALPLTVADKSRRAHVDAWRGVLSYEKQNPLKLSPSHFCLRVSQAFQTCLLSCAYRADLWFDYFQFLLAHQMPTKASEVLRRAIDRFLPGDELLQLILAEFFEDRKLPKAADAVYRNALSGALLEGPPQGGPLAGADYKASPILLLRYLDFIRRAYGIVAWRACFEEMAQLHRCSWEVFVAHAETEWKLCRSEQHALAALRKGAAKFRTQPQFIAAYADLLLDMGRLEGARELLRQSVLTLQSELGTGSRLLWKKWIRLESRFGDQTSLRSVIELRAMQRLSMGLDLGICAIGREGRDSFSLQAEGGESSPAALLEQEVLCNLPHRSKASDVGPKDLAQAKFNIRRRQFMGGDSLQDLCEVYTVRGVAPRTSTPEVFSLAQKGGDDGLFDGEGGGAKQGVSPEKERDEGDLEEEAPATGTTAQASAQWAMIVRPDLDSMAAFHPEFSTLYQPDYLQQQQQQPAAAAAGGDSSFMGSVTAREMPMFAPPKILCDIVALLPKPNGKLAADPDMVDYLLATLQATQLPPLPPVQHRPLVVKDLLALRHSQLHYLQASRHRGGEEGLGEGDAPGGQSEQEAEDMSDVSAEEVQRPSALQPVTQLAGQLAADFSRPTMAGGMQVAPAMYGAPHLMVPADSMMQARRMLAPAVIPGVRPIWTGMNMLPGPYAHLAAAPQLHPAMPLPYGISVAARPMQGVSLTRQPVPMWRVPDAASVVSTSFDEPSGGSHEKAKEDENAEDQKEEESEDFSLAMKNLEGEISNREQIQAQDRKAVSCTWLLTSKTSSCSIFVHNQQAHEAEAAVEKIEAKPPACSVQKTGKLLVATDPMDVLSVGAFAATMTKRHFTVHYPASWTATPTRKLWQRLDQGHLQSDFLHQHRSTGARRTGSRANIGGGPNSRRSKGGEISAKGEQKGVPEVEVSVNGDDIAVPNIAATQHNMNEGSMGG